ncbi:archaellin/type IV pilin N-terminal domain-containing protein [Halosimplex pelagicum]|uniref:Flagellin n=1 Tax=Halosimplex pelagicum TaxID=869886 RepID=A0A7D5P9S9_9EURY|nr:archaellin/type IV pilin N-terminal domain-containing protein [Halosimplex pelagicum]QLH84283.1 flagellin [Halosimplex pelagicum]
MLHNERNERDRGQVGIGTLIVFIAMVLVAAIAAGVLINTAGFLQTKSEETGQQSGQQVTNRLQVAAATGTNLSNQEVGVVNMTMKKSPGASNIDLENATVQWVGPSGTYNLVNASVNASGADGHFGIVPFKDSDGSHPVLNDPDDRMVMVFDLGRDDVVSDDLITLDTRTGRQTGENSGAGHTYFGEQVPEGASVNVKITTKSGATTSEQLTVPETLSGAEAVQL